MRITTTSDPVLAAVPASPLLRRGSLNRLALGAAAVGILGAVAASTLTTSTPADAAPAACTAAGLASTASGVLSQAGGFLSEHPEANDVLTSAATMPAEQAKSSVQGYFIGHLDQLSTLQGIAQPLTDLKSQCGIAVSPTQLATLLETVSK
ncbi:heme-binding protein [Mycolicibacter heraklionensis]|uniref:Heme-binding protein n=1 Tax=Mycolicibacter heraklionensis TaxID=512402 RepID=A0A9X7WHB8_9MYCO|nr:heme-binding protein [Mycolicibacter heraklionensis]